MYWHKFWRSNKVDLEIIWSKYCELKGTKCKKKKKYIYIIYLLLFYYLIFWKLLGFVFPILKYLFYCFFFSFFFFLSSHQKMVICFCVCMGLIQFDLPNLGIYHNYLSIRYTIFFFSPKIRVVYYILELYN